MSSNYHIDALLGESFTHKNSDFPAGTPVRIGYAFPSSRPADWPETSFKALTVASADDYEALVLEALALVEATCGVDFYQTTTSNALIQFGISAIPGDDTAGYAQTGYSYALNQYFSAVVYDDTLSSAGNMQSAILHEIGHALGLKHPGDYVSSDEGPFLPAAEDDTAHTVMSYNMTTDDALAFGPYDIEALQYLYGTPVTTGMRVGEPSGSTARTGDAGNELFALNSYELWQYDNNTTFMDEGAGYAATETGISIAAGAGTDEVYVPLARDQVTLDVNPDGSLTLTSEWEIELSGGSMGTLALVDQLSGVERLQFTDEYLAFDAAGAAGQAYGLFYAVLDAPPPPDLLGIWVERFDAGLTSAQVATEILDTYCPDLPSDVLVYALYYNLVEMAPPADVLANLVDLIDEGDFTQGEFYAAVAGLELNTDQFVELIGQGITYEV